MIKIPFSNLPNTTTPLNATNMNALQTNVENVFNGTVPAGNMVVDSIRSKNMFNKNNIADGSFDNTGAIISSSTIFYEIDYIEVKPNTKYTFSTTSRVDRLVICEYNSSKTFIQRNISINTSTYTITTTANTKYVRLCSVLSAIDTLQFEEGQTRTTYSPYQELNYNGETYLQTYNTITSGNFNDLVNTTIQGNTSKYYIQATNLTNQPTASYGWLTSYFQTNNTQVQIFIANNGVIYRRNKVGGSWGSWSSL